MPQVHKEKQKTPLQALESGGKGPTPGNKSTLKQVGFEEGSAMLTPPFQAKSKHGHGHGAKKPRAPKDALPQQTDAQNPQVVEDKAETQSPKRPEKEPNASKWWVHGQDLLSSANYCDLTKKASPDKAPALVAEAELHVATLKTEKPDVYKRLQATMNDRDLVMVALYSSQASYTMNAVLRGQLKSEPWVNAYAGLAAEAAAALKKAPKGVVNKLHTVQGKKLVDDSKKDDKVVPVGNVYRCDSWSGFFDPVFANEYRVGRSLKEPGFLSTTVNKGAYAADAPVKKTIEDPKIARAIGDMSMVATENEVLFPPGQRFQIKSIELEDTELGKRVPVADPTTLLPNSDYGKQAFNGAGKVWHVVLKQVGVAKGKKDGSGGKKGKSKASDTEAQAKKPPTFLEKLLGIANVMD